MHRIGDLHFALQAFLSTVWWPEHEPLASPAQLAEYEAKLAEWEAATAGIRPGGVAGFFRRLMETEGDIAGDLQMLSTHPSLDARLERLKSVEDSGAPAMTEEEWAAFKAMCD